MNEGWKTTELGNILELKRGYDLPKGLREEGEVPIVSSSGISGFHSVAKIEPPGVVTGRYGTIGKVYLIKESFWPLNTTLYVRDFKGNDPVFISYFLKTIRFEQFSDKAAVPGINRNHVHMEVVSIPPISAQNRIAEILSSLDQKIHLLRQQNATLESMAQALFKSWFVDFDPVIDNALAAGRTVPAALAGRVAKRRAVLTGGKYAGLPEGVRGLFPDGFVFSEELGRWVPEGWGVGTIGDLSIIKGGFAYKSKDFADAGYPVIKIKNINEDNTVNTHDVAYIPSSIGDQRPDFWLEDGDLIMAMTGATVGKIGVVVKHSELPHLLNQRVARFDASGKSSKYSSFLKCYFNSTAGREFIINTAEGSAQPNISGNAIASTPTVIASPSVLSKFEGILQGSTSSFIQNSKEIQTLTRLRDVLLPELISGRIRV